MWQSSTKLHSIRNYERTKIVYRYRTRGYHIVWNRRVEPLENKAIKSWIYMHLRCNWNTVEHLDHWIHMQNIKQTDTLRIGFKGRKKPPKEVGRHGNQNEMIAEFEANREFILNFLGEQAT